MGVSLQIKIESENAAFEEENAAAETVRILKKVVAELEETYVGQTHSTSLRDVNGNKCGSFDYESWDENATEED